MKNVFQVIKYSLLCITIMLSLLLFFDYIFIKYIIFSKEYSNQNKLQQLIESEDKDEIPVFGSSKARSSFIPDSISPNAFNYGMEKCNFDAVELLLNIECNKDKTTPIILEFNHRFFLHMPDHTINMGTFIPNLKYPVVRDYLRDNNKITLRHDLPGFRYFGNYIYYARYYVKEKMGSKKIISRGGNFSDFVPQPKVFNNFVNARLKAIKEFKHLSDKANNVEKAVSVEETFILDYLKTYLLYSEDTARINAFEKIVASNPHRLFIIVYTPLHWSESLGIENFDEIETLFKRWRKKFNNIKILDYSHLELADDCFKNSTHINLKGAQIFNSILKDDLGLFIDEE